jgi:hypothetical protein
MIFLVATVSVIVALHWHLEILLFIRSATKQDEGRHDAVVHAIPA